MENDKTWLFQFVAFATVAVVFLFVSWHLLDTGAGKRRPAIMQLHIVRQIKNDARMVLVLEARK